MSEYTEQSEVVATRAWDHRLFRRLLDYAKPHWKLFALSFGVLLLQFAGELMGPYIWRRALDGPVADALNAPIGTDPKPFRDAMIGWVGLYLGIVAALSLLRYAQVSVLNRTGQTVIHDLRTQLFRHIQRLDLAFFDRRPTGSLVTRVTTDIEHLAELFTSGVVTLGFDCIKVVVLLVALFWIHAQLALTVLLLVPVLIVISIAFRGGARRAHRVVRAKLATLNGYLQEVLSGVRVVQMFRREKRVAGVFQGHLRQYFEANKRTIFLFALFFPAMSLGVFLIQGFALHVGVGSMVEKEITYGLFFQFWLLLEMLVRPIRELGERYNVLQSAFASAERIFQVLDTQPEVEAPVAVQSLPNLGGRPPRIEFHDVRFHYEVGTEVVRGISFAIEPGQTVALVGATGSGKSTLINLLLRFYDVSGGSITLNGVDLRDLDLEEVRQHFGLVLQENFLFAGNVRDNLILDRDGISDEDLEEALQSSSADRLIERLPDGLEAEVAERGVTFSTGERQLLAIARTLAGRPDVVILDEATASVDSETEASIDAATANLLAGRSAFVVAHRLSTIRNADLILVLDQGQVVERGTHEELLEMRGAYYRLHELQFAVAE